MVTAAPPGTRRLTAVAAPRTPAVPRHRVPLLLAGLISLLAALWGGLLLLGLPVPTLLASTAADHGPLMALGFLGTVISLERAVALGRRWGYAAPALAGTAGLAALVSLPPVVGRLLLCTASIVVVVVVVVHRIQPALHLRVMAAAALHGWATSAGRTVVARALAVSSLVGSFVVVLLATALPVS